MNFVGIIGRLTSDPSIREGEKTKVASFRLAVPRPYSKDEVDFIQCKAFGKTADFLENYKSKGDEIAVEGRIQTGSYKNKDGNTVYTTDVICDRVESTHGSRGGNTEPREKKKPVPQEQMVDSFEQLDEDLPF